MMYPKPKSAPGRVATQQSKLAKNRSNAVKEMEAWARKADDAGTSNASRMSGQLTDNVTEERMLRAKLWELSKERYKFLAQNAYEKKVFTDRMQRKSSFLLRRASSAALSTCSEGDTGGRGGGGRPSARQRWQNARSALLNRLDPTKRKRARSSNPPATAQASSEDCLDSGTAAAPPQEEDKREKREVKGSAAGSVVGRNHVVPAATPITIRPGSGRLTLAPLSSTGGGGERDESPNGRKPPPPPHQLLTPLQLTNPRNVKFNKLSKTEPVRQSSAEARGLSPRRIPPSPGLMAGGRLPSSSVTGSSKPNSANSQRSKPPATAGGGATTQQATTAAATAAAFQGRQGILANRYGLRLESKTKDPRYSLLEKSLSPLQKRRSQTDVSSIVRSFDSLHMPPRRRKEAKPKIELKALEYMEEQGFLF